MTSKINNLTEFFDEFPNASWLEDSKGLSRYSNGEDEGSDHESEWFDEYEDICAHPDL